VKRIVYPPLQPNGARTGAACFGCGEIDREPASALRSKARKAAIMVIIENADVAERARRLIIAVAPKPARFKMRRIGSSRLQSLGYSSMS
jgi:hypothetical protein